MKMRVDEILVREGRRELDLDHVRKLADSIKELGLLNPVTVDKGNILIAGLHRLEAVKLLEWSEIECTVSSLDGLRAELAEIDENIVRNDFAVIEYGEMLLRRKEIYETLHPETKAGVAQAISMNRVIGNNVAAKSAATSKSFVQDTAEKLGVAQRTVRQQIQTAKNLTPETKEIVKEMDTKMTKKAVLKLSRLEPEQQKEAASLLAAKEIKSVDEYMEIKARSVPKQSERKADMPESVKQEEPMQEPEKHTPVSSVPYSLPEERCTSFKEVVADLKNLDKDGGDSADLFLAEYSSFMGKFIREVEWYAGSQYEPVFPLLTPEQLAYLRKQTGSVCEAAQDLYNKIERNVKK